MYFPPKPMRLIIAILALFAALVPSWASQRSGAPALPAFKLNDVDGRSHSSAELKGKPYVLFFYCGCEPCHKCARSWSLVQKSQTTAEASAQPQSIVVYMGNADEARQFQREVGLDLTRNVLLTDIDSSVSMTYGAVPCPRVFVVGKDGKSAYTNNHSDDGPLKGATSLIISRTVKATSGLQKARGK